MICVVVCPERSVLSRWKLARRSGFRPEDFDERTSCRSRRRRRYGLFARCSRPAPTWHCPVLVRRRISGDVVPPRLTVAAGGTWLPSEAVESVVSVRRIDYRCLARSPVEDTRFRCIRCPRQLRQGGGGAD